MAMLPGCLTYDEAYNTDGGGDIDHGFRLTVSALRANAAGRALYAYPASHAQGALLVPDFDGDALPMGARVRLKNSDETQAKVAAYSSASHAYARVLKALQQYGLIVVDGGLDLDTCGIYDSRWNSVGQTWINAFRLGIGADGRPISGLSRVIDWTDFEVVAFNWPGEPNEVLHPF